LLNRAGGGSFHPPEVLNWSTDELVLLRTCVGFGKAPAGDHEGVVGLVGLDAGQLAYVIVVGVGLFAGLGRAGFAYGK
jgi:hypothetical protein